MSTRYKAPKLIKESDAYYLARKAHFDGKLEGYKRGRTLGFVGGGLFGFLVGASGVMALWLLAR